MKRSVDMSEVRESLELWIAGAEKEITSLTEKEAITRMSKQKFDAAKSADPNIRVHPAKLACTEALTESKEGKRELERKVRIVACENFSLTTGDATFSATPDITALRLILGPASFARKSGD